MTGFAVVVRFASGSVTRDELRAFLPSLRRRGPHGETILSRDGWGLASALLDVGDRRLVPSWASAGPFVVAGQIRVDARRELVDALRREGAAAVSEDDPDVQLFAHAWNAWRGEAPARVLGDFSAVVHDRISLGTTLVRDPFGVRMLFYHTSAERLVASNTLDAVLASGVSRELDEDAIADFVAEGFNENPATTTFASVRRVPPAHWLSIGPDGRQELREYWTLPAPAVDRSRGDDEIVSAFRSLLAASVQDRLRTSRVSIYMSGGLDSTTLAALAIRAVDDPSRLMARTMDLPTLAPSDEVERARLAATAIGIAQVVVDLDAYGYPQGTGMPRQGTPEPNDELDLAGMQDDFLRASAHGPVAFWGEDPDAYLAPPNLVELLRGSNPLALAADAASYAWREGRRPHLAIRELIGTRSGAPATAGPTWLRGDLRRRRAERVQARAEPTHPTRSEVARRLQQWDWQPFLETLDAGFHRVPLDVRLPFLDLRLITYALAVPPIPWLQRKHLLRETASGLVPDAVRLAPKRGLPGVYQGRLEQWWARDPSPFVPSPALSQFVDVGALPQVSRASSIEEARMHLRLRVLDEWLRAYGGQL